MRLGASSLPKFLKLFTIKIVTFLRQSVYTWRCLLYFYSRWFIGWTV